LAHRVVRRLPAAPTVANVKALLRPPAAAVQDGRQVMIHSAYVMHSNLAPLLDCLTDAPTDARGHLDSLGVRPMWRSNAGAAATNEAQTEAAAKALAPRLRTTAETSVLVVLFSPSRAQRASETSAASAAPGQGEVGDSVAHATCAAAPPAVAGRPASSTYRRPSSSARRLSAMSAASGYSDAASEGYMEPLSRPIALQPRPNYADGTAPSEAWAEEVGGFDESAPPPDDEAFDVDEFDAEAQLAVAAARHASRGICGPSALQSRHCLPTAGNWVRLSAGQQHVVTKEAASARRRAATAGHFNGFGSEPRLSTSRTWAHQTSAQRLGGSSAAGPGAAGGADVAKPGSFLPLKACVSTLHAHGRARASHG